MHSHTHTHSPTIHTYTHAHTHTRTHAHTHTHTYTHTQHTKNEATVSTVRPDWYRLITCIGTVGIYVHMLFYCCWNLQYIGVVLAGCFLRPRVVVINTSYMCICIYRHVCTHPYPHLYTQGADSNENPTQ